MRAVTRLIVSLWAGVCYAADPVTPAREPVTAEQVAAAIAKAHDDWRRAHPPPAPPELARMRLQYAEIGHVGRIHENVWCRRILRDGQFLGNPDIDRGPKVPDLLFVGFDTTRQAENAYWEGTAGYVVVSGEAIFQLGGLTRKALVVEPLDPTKPFESQYFPGRPSKAARP